MSAGDTTLVTLPTVHVALALAPADQAMLSERLRRAGLQAVFLRTTAALGTALPEVELLLLGRPPRIDWSSAKRLRLLHVAGAGVDPLFPAQGLREQVVITNSRGTMADAVRDHVLALLFAFARDLPRAFAQQATRSWQSYSREPIRDQSLCVVGLGEIGSRVARAGVALGLRVSGVCRSPRAFPGLDPVRGMAELGQAFGEADYVVLCLPLTSSTGGLCDDTLLSTLSPRAVLIDVSRGGIVDQVALERRLRAGQLRGAALDVFADEPLPPSSPLWTCPGLLVTPHSAGFTPTYFEPVVELFIDVIERLSRGEQPKTLVSREEEY
jgi:phosphoglycerate dehydrogenase-like enzyme